MRMELIFPSEPRENIFHELFHVFWIKKNQQHMRALKWWKPYRVITLSSSTLSQRLLAFSLASNNSCLMLMLSVSSGRKSRSSESIMYYSWLRLANELHRYWPQAALFLVLQPWIYLFKKILIFNFSESLATCISLHTMHLHSHWTFVSRFA